MRGAGRARPVAGPGRAPRSCPAYGTRPRRRNTPRRSARTAACGPYTRPARIEHGFRDAVLRAKVIDRSDRNLGASAVTEAANPTGQHETLEEPLELRRHWRTIRSNWPLILAVVVPITLLVLVLSLVLPRTYTAQARIVLEDTPGLQTDSVDATQRQLSTLQTLLTSRAVLTRAAGRLKGEDADSLTDKVSASVDPNANFINVIGKDNHPGQAAAIANSVAAAFLSKRRETDRLRLARSRTALLEALRRLEGSPGVDSAIERQALQERLSEVNTSQATAGSALQVAQLARPPASPSSPKPVRNTIFALAAGLFLGVLAALARGQLAPKIDSARELSRLVGIPILATIPRRTRFKKAHWERDREAAYANLQAALQLRMNGRQEVVLLTSAVPEEGKTELTAELGRTLAASGLKTLLVSADLRRPTLHESFGVGPSPGLGDLL